jgi:hypothetical protein
MKAICNVLMYFIMLCGNRVKSLGITQISADTAPLLVSASSDGFIKAGFGNELFLSRFLRVFNIISLILCAPIIAALISNAPNMAPLILMPPLSLLSFLMPPISLLSFQINYMSLLPFLMPPIWLLSFPMSQTALLILEALNISFF